MVGLFGNRGEKAAQEEAAQAEAARLAALSPGQLAIQLLPAFGSGEKKPIRGSLMAASWLMSSYPRGDSYLKELTGPVKAAIQALEHAGLVEINARNIGGSLVSITEAGELALSEGTVATALGSS